MGTGSFESLPSVFAKHADDIYIGSNFIKQYDLRIGNLVKVIARAPKDRERFLSTNEVIEIEGIPAEDWESPPVFENLTAISPRERIILEPSDGLSVSPRVVDLIAPLGKGQRGVIVAPPRGGKTILLKQIAKSIVDNHKEVELLILLLDERPKRLLTLRKVFQVLRYIVLLLMRALTVMCQSQNW